MAYSKKGWERRKAERAGYGEFYQKHIQIIKTEKRRCLECGAKLRGNASEVAHILPKGTFKSVATNDENVIYLCGMQSVNQCHTNFDTFSVEKFQKMLVFNQVSAIFAKLEDLVTEKISWKIYDKYLK